jgi:hypothetical protein
VRSGRTAGGSITTTEDTAVMLPAELDAMLLAYIYFLNKLRMVVIYLWFVFSVLCNRIVKCVSMNNLIYMMDSLGCCQNQGPKLSFEGKGYKIHYSISHDATTNVLLV